jgi:Na+/proline symporter
MAEVGYWIALAAFSALVISLGAFGYRVSRKSFVEYAIAGGCLGYLVTYFYLTWTVLSAFTVMGYIGTCYRTGVAYIFAPFPGIIGDMIAILLFGSWFIAYRELYGATTPAEALGMRYQSRLLRVLIAALWFIFLCPYIALQNAAVARLMTPLYGTSYEVGLAFCVVLVLLYTFLGGARGAAWTSVPMGLIATIGFLLPILYISVAVISPTDALAKARTEWWLVPGPAGVYTPAFAIAFAFLFGITGIGWPHRAMAAMAARSRKVLKLIAALLLATHFVMFSIATLIALIFAKALVPELKGAVADAAYLIMIQKFCPRGFDLLYFFVVLSAALTTAATQALVCGSFFANDIYRVLRPKASSRELVWVSSIMVVLSSLAGLAWAVCSPISVGLFLTHIASPGLGIATPLMVGIIWRRASAQAGIVAIVVGLLTSVVNMAYPQAFAWFPYPPAMPMILSFIALFITCLFVKPSEEVCKKYVDEVREWLRTH